MTSGIKNNVPAAIRKIEADQRAFASATGVALADYFNIAFAHVRKQGFLTGPKGKWKNVAGANLGPSTGRGMRHQSIKGVHKSKVVDRSGGRMINIFKQPSWGVANASPQNKEIIVRASNENVELLVTKVGTGVRGTVELGGAEGGRILAILAKNPRLQYRRRILKVGLDNTSRRLKGLAEYRLNGAIKKRNRVPIK